MQAHPVPFNLTRAALLLSAVLSFIAGTLLLDRQPSTDVFVVSTLALVLVLVFTVLLVAD